MNEGAVDQADDEACFSGHAGVDGVSGEEIAEDGVFTVGGATSDLIAGIEVAEGKGDFFGLEEGFDLVPEEGADIGEFHVPGCVFLRGLSGEEILARPFGDDDDGVPAFRNSIFEHGQKSARPAQLEGDFGNQGEVDILAGDGRAGGDEPGVPAHEFDQGNAVFDAVDLGMSGVDDAAGFIDGGEIAEGSRHEADIVVDGFWNPDDGEGIAPLAGGFVELEGAALGAVASDAEEDIDAMADEIFHGELRIDRAAGGSQDGAAILMNVIDFVRGEGPGGHTSLGIQALIAIAKAQDFRDAVAMAEFEEEGANHVVQARTKSAAGDDAGAGLIGSEKKFFAGSCQFKLLSLLSGQSIALNDKFRDAIFVADKAPSGGRDAGFAKAGNFHRWGYSFRYLEFNESKDAVFSPGTGLACQICRQ